MLLIDEIDRADDEFEAFLFELLAESAVTIPELGTLRAALPPVVVLTSNRTRDLHDAFKRRCLYHWIDYPDLAERRRDHPPPGAGEHDHARRAGGRRGQRLRTLDIQKPPGVAEAINWTMALDLLGIVDAGRDGGGATLGSVLKYREDAEVAAARGLDWVVGGAEPAADLATVAGGLGHLVHTAGVPVTPERSARLAASIALASRATVDELYWLARVTLVSTAADIRTFDRVFRQLFGGLWDPADYRGDTNAPSTRAAPSDCPCRPGRGALRPDQRRPPRPTPSLAGDGTADGDDRRCRVDPRRVAAPRSACASRSSRRSPRTSCSSCAALMSRLALAPPPRRSRRTARHHRGGRIDLRPACGVPGAAAANPSSWSAAATARGGGGSWSCATSAARWSRTPAPTSSCCTPRRAAPAPRRSCSRPGYPPHQGAARQQPGPRPAPGRPGGARLVGRDADRASREGLQRALRRRGMARGAVVVIVSDGWERDDPALLGQEMERLPPARPPRDLGQSAQGGARLRADRSAGWRPRCRTSTGSSAATRWRRSTTCSPPSRDRSGRGTRRGPQEQHKVTGAESGPR